MATQTAFFTDFTEYSVGAFPADWSEPWGLANTTTTVESSGIPSGGGSQALKVTRSGTDYNLYATTWDDVGTLGDEQVQVLTKVYVTDVPSAGIGRFFVAAMHVAGTDGNEQGWAAMHNFFDPAVEIREISPGDDNQLVYAFDASLGPDKWIWFRFDYDGTDLRVRAWPDGTTEPGTWDATVAAPEAHDGSIGIVLGVDGTMWIDQIGVGIEGREAPSTAAVIGRAILEDARDHYQIVNAMTHYALQDQRNHYQIADARTRHIITDGRTHYILRKVEQ